MTFEKESSPLILVDKSNATSSNLNAFIEMCSNHGREKVKSNETW